MKMSSQTETVATQFPVFRRGPAVRAAKSVLSSAQSFLPREVYGSLYNFAFGVYKGLLRLAYSRHLVTQAIIGNSAGRQRAKLVHSVMPYSLVGSSGLEATYDAATTVIRDRVPGDFVECGVAQGGCSALMSFVARTDPGRRMWLFDSFQGLPDPTKEDFQGDALTGDHVRPLPKGSCLGTKSQVEQLLFSKFELSRDSVHLVEGWFQDTLSIHGDRIGKIALLRIDGDWYESTLCCLENYYDRVSPRGYIIIDDFGTCFGCKKAVLEFLEGRGIRARLMPDGRGGVFFSKPA